MSDKLSRFQRDEINSIANILNETLSKLKKPNTHFLQPLERRKSSPDKGQQRSGGGDAVNTKTSPVRREGRLSLLDIVGGIRQSIQGAGSSGAANTTEAAGGGAEPRYRSRSPTG